MSRDDSGSPALEAQDSLLYSARHGELLVVKALLEAKAEGKLTLDINCKGKSKSNLGWTPLHLASYFGHVEVVEALLEAGANIDEVNDTGDTALHKASFVGNEELVILLLKHNADVNIMNGEGKTAGDVCKTRDVQRLLEAAQRVERQERERRLLTAAKEGRVEEIQELLSSPNPPNINCVDAQGNTCLHCAAYRGHARLAVLLLQNGVDTTLKNNSGQFAIELAKDNDMREVLSVRPVQRLQRTASRFEGPLLKRSRFLGWRPVWAVLQRGVLLYYSSRAEAARVGGRWRTRSYLDGATLTAPDTEPALIVISFSDGDSHRVAVPPTEKDVVACRQTWITALNEHIAYSGHYLWAGASPDTAREATEDLDDECKPLGSMQDALTAATNSLALLDTQLRECSAIVAALDKSVNVGNSLHHSAYMRFQHACGTGSEALASLRHCAALVAQARDRDAAKLAREDTDMANQWGQKAEELEITNKVAGLGLKKSLDQTTESDEAPDAPNPAEASLLMKIIRQGLVESKLDIEVQRKDPNSPLYSVKTFEALHLKPNLLKGVYDMGFNAPSKIQETALPTLLADPPQNMIAQSQSGTGKTAAFVLAMLSRVDTTKNYPQVLCLSPTYELAIQTGEVAAKMAKFCPEIKLKYAVRGEEVPRGTKITDHIIIGTPGKMLDWGVKFGMFDLSKIKVFVLDEADVMIDRQGHQDQCIRIHKCLPSTCQMMFFSATYDSAVMEFAEIIVPNPIIIRLLREEESLDNIKQYYVKCKSSEEKYRAICNIYGVITIGQAIIFCHTRKTAGWLSEKMSKDGHSVAVLSGELTVEQRIAVLDRFRAGLEVLITTNVLSRGIDVEQVTLVVNFDMPMDMNKKADCETYLHRIGRTGRFGKAGIAINLIDSPLAMEICTDIEAHFGKKIKLLDIEDAEEIEKIGA